ncbi:MAG: MarR family transcriptional regulator [SAR86 cluster bacterium]|uniref:MarR family transcriptional regulator n=1 Tax=SAR86 cluster bacterium TaxID=2030880 RepID=A0A2A4WZP6_9GAMM|nr:MAG: MarR family transcriptional regulator [SAR86 cluster bacterium]
MLQLYENTGKMALGSRLKQLSEMLAEQAARVYELYEVSLDPKWFPVFYMLKSGSCLPISVIAEAIGHSHASVSKIAKEMTAAGILKSEKLEGDARVNQVCLTDKGRSLLPFFDRQTGDMEAVVEELLVQCQHNIWEAISEVEYLLQERDLFSRVRDKYAERDRENIELIEYKAEHATSFRDLNYEWINKHFEVEESDAAMLEDPEKTILATGGYIVIANYKGSVVGACALIRHDADRVELAKMAVDDSAKGKGIGYLLGQHCVDKARELNYRQVFLESNTKLIPAISLYKKLGFKRIKGEPSPYARCNIQMLLTFP